MKNNKMEEFKNNLEGFSPEFIQLALNYFTELEKEKELQEMATVEEVLDYYSRIGSFTCNSSQSYYNLHNFLEDISKLYINDTNNIMNLNDYFFDIEDFELQVLNVLFYEFYPQKEEEEEEINWDE